MIHLTAHQLSTYLDRELPESSTELVRRHLEGCAECALRFEAFREQETILDRVLVHDPGEDFFGGFSDRVLGPDRRPAPAIERGRAPAKGTSKAPAIERTETPATDRSEAPPPKPERVVAAPVPERRKTARAGSHGRSRQQPAVPWFAAAILCLIVGAIGYTLPRPSKSPSAVSIEEPPAPRPEPARNSIGPEAPSKPLPKPETPVPEPEAPIGAPEIRTHSPETPSPAPEMPARARETPARAPETAAETPIVAPEPSVAPVRRFRTTTSVDPAPARPMPPARPVIRDEFAGAPLSAAPLLSMARRASQAAAADSSAANLDVAAQAWDQAVPALTGAEQMIARRHLAEARYRAWVAAPDAYRAASAIASLRSFLVLAPASPERDLAKERLRRIGG